MRKLMMAANWKMNKTSEEALQFVRDFLRMSPPVSEVDVVIFPPFTAIYPLSRALDKTGVYLGAQNMYYETSGAFTGEISGDMLAAEGVTYVIIGHSERRHILGESDAVIAKKIRAALKSGLTPVLCVGETLQEREAGDAAAVVTRQLKAALSGMGGDLPLVVAYEPVWAIGTGKTASEADAQEMAALIRKELASITAAAECMRILYGGSVTPDNVGLFLQSRDIDGALVGGASLDPGSFYRLSVAAKAEGRT
ncbi:MAG: triose-phosphate isomerase [Bacillota bacterium]